MSRDSSTIDRSAWRQALPVLSGPTVVLREPAADDLAPLLALLATAEAPGLNLDEITAHSIGGWIERTQDDRRRGLAFSYVVTIGNDHLVGALTVRALDALFESAESDMFLLASVRGSSVFLESARLVGTFAFAQVGAHRIECRVQLQNGRANGALRKLGASQEGLLRRSVRRDREYVDQVLWSILKEDWAGQTLQPVMRVH